MRIRDPEASAGLRRLLRRSVGVRDLLKTGFDLWSQQRSRLPRRFADGQVEGARNVIRGETEKPSAKMDPVAAYRKIVNILSERS